MGVLLEHMLTIWESQSLPTLVIAKDRKAAGDLHRQLSTYMSAKNRNTRQRQLFTPVFFEGTVSAQTISMMGAIARGESDKIRLIVVGL